MKKKYFFWSLFWSILISPWYLAKRAADTIQSDRIDAGVHKTETKSQNPADVPERVERVLRVRIEVEPQQEQMMRKEADGENHDKRQDHLGHLCASKKLDGDNKKKTSEREIRYEMRDAYQTDLTFKICACDDVCREKTFLMKFFAQPE